MASMRELIFDIYEALKSKNKKAPVPAMYHNPFSTPSSKIVRIGQLMDNLAQRVRESGLPDKPFEGNEPAYTQTLLEQRLPLLLKTVMHNTSSDAAAKLREANDDGTYGVWQGEPRGETYVSVKSLSVLMTRLLDSFPQDEAQSLFLKFNAAAVNDASDYSGMKASMKPVLGNLTLFRK